MELQLLTVLGYMLVCGPLLAKGACPDLSQYAPMVESCLPEFNKLRDLTKGPITATQLNDFCSSSARTTEIQCAENIIDECKQASPTARRALDRVIDINAFRGSVNILCNNIQVFAEKQDCIGQYQRSVTSCIITEIANYRTKLRSLQVKAVSEGAEWFEEKAYEELCDYVGEVADCHKPYGQNCGREIGDVFDALIHAFTPPVCVGVMEHANLVLLISLAVVAVVKGQM